MSNAFISWLSLFGGRNPIEATGKLVALWFDTLIIETPSEESIPNVLDVAAERKKIPQEICDELLTHWRPIQGFVPECCWEPAPRDGANRLLWETVVEVVYEASARKLPHYNRCELAHEVAMASNGLLRSCLFWHSINAIHGAAFITSDREASVGERLFIRHENRSFDVFRHFAERRIPNLDDLSWRQVWELRAHPKIEEFRRWLSLASGANASVSSPKIAEELEDEFRAKLEEFAELCRPSPLRAVGKVLVSNVPLKVPFNPYPFHQLHG